MYTRTTLYKIQTSFSGFYNAAFCAPLIYCGGSNSCLTSVHCFFFTPVGGEILTSNVSVC